MSAGLKLQGQFKFDLLDSSGNLIKSSNFIDNFITNSGVMYPYHFAFADCFRYLSIGIGSDLNCIRFDDEYYGETTGLSVGIPEYAYLGGRNSYDKPDTNYALYPACGYSFSSGKISLIRQWTIPDNTGGVFSSAGTFNEFMVSPGRPYVIDPNENRLCSCNDVSPSHPDDFSGLDCSTVSEYYSWVKDLYPLNKKLNTCDAVNAFARVIYPIDYTENSILNITYVLNIAIDTGVNFRSMHYDNTSSQNWSGDLNAIFNITQPGIKLINDGNISGPFNTPDGARLQHCDYSEAAVNPEKYCYKFENEYGESFVPPHGIPLEPSKVFRQERKNQNIVYYLTNDSTQFLVDSRGGKFKGSTAKYAPWNFWDSGAIYSSGDIVYSGDYSYKNIYSGETSGIFVIDTDYWENLGYLNIVSISNSGLKPYSNDTSAALKGGQQYWTNNPSSYNIRISGIGPDPNNVLLDSGLGENSLYYFAQGEDEPYFQTFNYNGDNYGGIRAASVSYTFNFSQYTDYRNMPVKNLVGAYKDLGYDDCNNDTKTLIPFFDCLFSGTGDFFLPSIVTGVDDVGATGASISGWNDSGYFYLYSASTSVYPIFNSVLKWSVPCPEGVIGCD